MTTLRSAFLLVSVAGLATLLGACGGSTNSDGSGGNAGTGGSGGSGGGCDANGQHYQIGESWSDQCNSCTCKEGGPSCTLSLCGCEYDGSFYSPGESFPASDGCNQCTCQNDNSVACTLKDCAPGCVYNGEYHQIGESWKLDACNSCFCGNDGQVACTGAYCPPECVYAGTTYQIGESFPSLDGCNTCTCGDAGIGCTKLACACDPKKEWWKEYVLTDPAACAVADFGCPANTTGFENQCGCGCEQDVSCPEFIDCMPPKDCTDLVKKCPYSGIAY